MRATLKNHHQAPRKVRLVADAIRGKSVLQAKRSLMFLNKKAAEPVEKLLDSAIANASLSGALAEDLIIKTVTVNKGAMQKRGRPFGRGRSGTIHKTMSHVVIELAPMQRIENRKQKTENTEQKTVKKAAKKTSKAK